MKTALYISYAIVILALAALILGRYVFVIPDWAIRVAGIITFIDLIVMGYLRSRLGLGKKDNYGSPDE